MAKTWVDGEIITKDAMNDIEGNIAANSAKITTIEGKLVKAVAGSKDGMMSKEDKTKLDGVEAQANKYTLPAANKTTLGGVKQAVRVDEAADANVTKAEFKALLDALKAAGIMATS